MKEKFQKVKNWLGFEKLNLRRLFAQAVVLSLTIYAPFFLQNWHEKSEESHLNEMYKSVLADDLSTDLKVIGIVNKSIEIYLDSTMAVLRNPADDSSSLHRRIQTTLTLGFCADFQAATNADDYIHQFRDHGDAGDLDLIRHLGNLKSGYEILNMIETRRMDFVQELHTPLFIHQYNVTGSGLEPVNPAYFNSSEYLNTIIVFQQLATQVQIMSKATQKLIESTLLACEEDILKIAPEAPEANQ